MYLTKNGPYKLNMKQISTCTYKYLGLNIEKVLKLIIIPIYSKWARGFQV